MAEYLEPYPLCTELMIRMRSFTGNETHTPCSTLHFYADRSRLKVDYECLNAPFHPPYVLRCKVASIETGVEYAVADGKARTKKEAKQIAAAAAIEMLRRHYDESALVAKFEAAKMKRGIPSEELYEKSSETRTPLQNIRSESNASAVLHKERSFHFVQKIHCSILEMVVHPVSNPSKKEKPMRLWIRLRREIHSKASRVV